MVRSLVLASRGSGLGLSGWRIIVGSRKLPLAMSGRLGRARVNTFVACPDKHVPDGRRDILNGPGGGSSISLSLVSSSKRSKSSFIPPIRSSARPSAATPRSREPPVVEIL